MFMSFHNSSDLWDSLGWTFFIFCQIYFFISNDGFQIINHSRGLHHCIRHKIYLSHYLEFYKLTTADICRVLQADTQRRQQQAESCHQEWELKIKWKETICELSLSYNWCHETNFSIFVWMITLSMMASKWLNKSCVFYEIFTC